MFCTPLNLQRLGQRLRFSSHSEIRCRVNERPDAAAQGPRAGEGWRHWSGTCSPQSLGQALNHDSTLDCSGELRSINDSVCFLWKVTVSRHTSPGRWRPENLNKPLSSPHSTSPSLNEDHPSEETGHRTERLRWGGWGWCIRVGRVLRKDW